MQNQRVPFDLRRFASLTGTECCIELKTDSEAGLSNEEAAMRLYHDGPNILETQENETLFDILVEQLSNPLILLLIGSSFVSLIIGELQDAISITVTVCIVITVAMIQEHQSSKSMEALYKLAPPRCHVVRAGKSENTVAMNLVVGDIIRVARGDRIPADCRILSCVSLEVDESNLTGETERISKTEKVERLSDSPTSYAWKQNLIFMGTLVKYGHGIAVVVGTGKATELGAMMDVMSAIIKPKTPLQTKMDELGRHLTLISFIVISIIGMQG